MGRASSSERFGTQVSTAGGALCDRSGGPPESERRSGIATVVCVPLTSNLAWSGAPGNVLIDSRVAGLSRDSVANVSQLIAVDKALLTEHVGRLPNPLLERVFEGIELVLDR